MEDAEKTKAQLIAELDAAKMALVESEARSRRLFDDSPLSLWEQDFSAVKIYLDDLRGSGVTDLRAFFAEHPEAVSDCITKIKLVDVNRATLALYGAQSKDALLTGLDSYVTDESQAIFAEELIAFANGATRFEGENVNRTINGELIYCLSSTLIASGFEQTWEKVLVSIIDITERTRAEVALRQSEARYRVLFEGINYPIFVHDKEGNILEVNQAASHRLGYSHDELLQMKVTDIDTPEFARGFEDRLARQIAEGGLSDIRVAHVGKDGRRIDVDVNTKVIDYQGQQAILSVCRDITERQQAEDALRESEARYRSLFDDSPISLWEQDFSAVKTYLDDLRGSGVTDLQAFFAEHPEAVSDCITKIKLIDVNQASLTLYKAQSKEELLIGLDRYFTEESLDVFREELLAFADGATRFGCENVNRTLTGEAIHCGVSVSIAPGSEQTWEKVVVSIIDISERKRVEMALRESTERFRLAFHTSPDSININRLGDGMYIEINDGFTNIMGYTSEDVVGKTSLDLSVWNNPNDRARLVTKLREDGYCENLEAEFLSKSGAVKVGLMSARIIILNDIPHILSITRDITERKRSEEALRESQYLLQKTFDTIREAVFVLNADLQFVAGNTAIERIFGYTPDELIGQNYAIFVPESMFSDPEQQERQRELYEKGFLEQEEYYFKKKDGTEFPANFSATIRRGDQGEFAGMVGTVQDITERKQLEAESREADLLRVELEKEKEVVALKERIISTVSHEFRTPLSIIQTASDLLLYYFDKLEETRREQLLRQINAQILRMADLIDTVLTLSRTQAGKTEFNPALLDLEPFCRELFEQVRFTDNGQHQLVFTSHSPNQPVMVDARLLRHILTNLLTNAAKYSPEQSRIHFELDSDTDRVIFRVRDEGIGIPEEDWERLFEPFHRASNVGSIGGTGLGLSISKHYAELHGGDIEVESVLGKGTTFTVSLPVR